jgi:hypothetical protein
LVPCRIWKRSELSVMLGLKLQAKNDHEDSCNGTCPVCVQTRRMVSAVVAGSVNEIVAYLADEDLDSAQKHGVALLAVLDEVPSSTAELIGDHSFLELKKAIEKGLWEIASGELAAASVAFQSGLSAWYETYPPYQA